MPVLGRLQVNNLREIQALRRLSPHPHIIKLLEVLYDQPTGRLALVFELMVSSSSVALARKACRQQLLAGAGDSSRRLMSSRRECTLGWAASEHGSHFSRQQKELAIWTFGQKLTLMVSL